MKARAERGTPILDFFGGLFRPAFSLWSFAGQIPHLIWGMFALCCVLVGLLCAFVLLQFFKAVAWLFKK